jgi:hypothetical protein
MNVQDLCTAIRLIPHIEFTERTAHLLIDAISGRIDASNFSHNEYAINACEYLDDAATVMENAADDITAENYREAA